MKREDAEEFTQALGQVVAGSWRQIAWAKRMGVPEALELDTEQWVRERLGGYIRLSVEERREAARELANEGMSQREIGDVLGVGAMTVNRDLNVPNDTDDAADPQQILTRPSDIVPNDTPQTEDDERDIAAPPMPVWSAEDERQRVTLQKIEAAQRAAQTLLISFSSNVETIQQGLELGASIKFEPDHVALYKQAVSALNVVLKKGS